MSLRSLLVTGALVWLGASIAQPAPVADAPEDELAVAVIEDWASNAVTAREILTRKGLEDLLVERAGTMLVGFNPEDLRGETSPSSGAQNGEERGGSSPSDDRSEFFSRSREALLSNAGPPPAQTGPASEERTTLVFPVPQEWQGATANLQQGVERIRSEAANPDEEALSRSARRFRLQFETQTIGDWVDRTLVAMEARRRGYTVNAQQIAEALVPMIQARRSQLESAQEESQTPATPATVAEIARLGEALQRVQSAPNATADPQVQRELRAEVEEILTEEGHDRQRFFEELHVNLLADQLIRATVYEFYTEEDLRAYHRSFLQQFLTPARFRYLSVKYILRPDDPEHTEGSVRDAFRALDRRLKRVGADEPIGQVITAWRERVAAEDDLPPLTYLSLSDPRTVTDMPEPVARALADLELGGTSDVIEEGRGIEPQRFTIFYIVRLVEALPAKGENFEDVRPLVENQFFDAVRTQLVDQLRQRYHIWQNRRGAPIEEALADLGSPGATPGAPRP
jgi:hypothetical protein